MYSSRSSFFVRLGIASFLAFGLSHCWISMAHAQLPNAWDLDNNANQQLSIHYVRRGNIHINDVWLDGEPLFKVAAPATNEDKNARHNILPIEWRVNEIETRLGKIVRNGFDPDALQVTVSTLNNQTVIIVAGHDWALPLMTVTEYDRQIDSTSNALSEIAETRAAIVKEALLKANRERQPEYLLQQFYALVIMLSMVIASSLTMRRLQKLLKQRWQKLNQAFTKDTSSELTDTNTVEVPQNSSSQWISFSHLQSLHLPQFSLLQRRNINLTLRSLLWWGQITIWLGGSMIALLLFPQTRLAGVWLISVPVSFIAILLGLSVAKKISDILIVYWLGQ